jgi:tRNA1Val (adenine37-N6)-methyltransferase
MSASHFSFKQFTIQQELCAMKVGTDGVLLGAWADVKSTSQRVNGSTSQRVNGSTDGAASGKWSLLQLSRVATEVEHSSTSILDVGTGTGLIALMAAQRNPEAHVVALDIDADAVQQAKENVNASPFAERITVVQGDFRTFSSEEGEGARFDTILCNPPYFERALRCPDDARTLARHNDTLSLEELAQHAATMLLEGGTLAVILPFERRGDMIAECATFGLSLIRETHVRTLPGKAPKRVLLEFGKGVAMGEMGRMGEMGKMGEMEGAEVLTIEEEAGVPTPEFRALLKDFYLKF